jgi:hypothetical protein
LKSSVFKDEYIEYPMAIITLSALANTDYKPELNLAPKDSFEKRKDQVEYPSEIFLFLQPEAIP